MTTNAQQSYPVYLPLLVPFVAVAAWWIQEQLRRSRIGRSRRVQVQMLLEGLYAVTQYAMTYGGFIQAAWTNRLARAIAILQEPEAIAALPPRVYQLALLAVTEAEHAVDNLKSLRLETEDEVFDDLNYRRQPRGQYAVYAHVRLERRVRARTTYADELLSNVLCEIRDLIVMDQRWDRRRARIKNWRIMLNPPRISKRSRLWTAKTMDEAIAPRRQGRK